MNSKGMWMTALASLAAAGVLAQAPAQAPAGAAPAAPAARQQGPGVQAPNDARYAEWIASKCKDPQVARGGGGGGRGPGGGGAGGGGRAGGGGGGGGGRGPGGGGRGPGGGNDGPPAHRDYTVTEIPGVIAAGQTWKSIWTGTGNNADGIVATPDGGILVAQNTDSKVMKIDKDNKFSFPYTDTDTGGALSMNKNGALFLVSRALPSKVLQLEPTRRVVTDMYNGEPLDCLGGVINDLTADSKGGVYFTMGPITSAGLFYVDSNGVVTKYGENLNTNGLILSADEKTLYVTTRGIVAFDVQPNGSLTNQRQFASSQGGTGATGGGGGSDGLAVDAAGRVYVAVAFGGGGVQVFASDGKLLGVIAAPLNFVTVGFSGPDKKTLYGVANNQRFDEIFTIEMIAQGYQGRAK